MPKIEDSYKTAKIPIFSSMNTYTDGDDSTSFIPTIINGVIEKLSDPFSGNSINYMTQRPSIITSDTITNSTNWFHHAFYPYICLDNIIYKQLYGGTQSTVWTGTNMSTENGSRFTLIRDTINSDDVLGFIEGGTGKFVTINLGTGVATVQTAVSFVANPFIATLDGYTFIAADGTDDIYNSNLNDITTWNLGVNFIRSSNEPGPITALVNYKNYIIAFKETSCEFFYDAGNTGTSPLQRNDNLKSSFGCPWPWSIGKETDKLVWVGRGESGNTNCVFMMDQDQIQKISTPQVEKFLKDLDDSETAYKSRLTANGAIIRANGNSYYILSIAREMALVYCFENSQWSQWEVNEVSGTIFDISNTNSDLGVNMFYFVNGGNSTKFGAFSEYQKSYDTIGDVNTPIIITTTSPPVDLGTMKRKILSLMRWVGTIEPNYNVRCYWSDDNQHTISNKHVFPIGSNPVIRNLGQFRRREFTFEFVNVQDINTPNTISSTILPRIRMEGIEVEYREGAS